MWKKGAKENNLSIDTACIAGEKFKKYIVKLERREQRSMQQKKLDLKNKELTKFFVSYCYKIIIKFFTVEKHS